MTIPSASRTRHNAATTAGGNTKLGPRVWGNVAELDRPVSGTYKVVVGEEEADWGEEDDRDDPNPYVKNPRDGGATIPTDDARERENRGTDDDDDDEAAVAVVVVVIMETRDVAFFLHFIVWTGQ